MEIYQVMFFFIHWGTKSYYYDIDAKYLPCNQCGKYANHAVRLFEEKTRLYWLITVWTNRYAITVCQNCLKEKRLFKEEEQKLIESFRQNQKKRKEEVEQ